MPQTLVQKKKKRLSLQSSLNLVNSRSKCDSSTIKKKLNLFNGDCIDAAEKHYQQPPSSSVLLYYKLIKL